MRIPNVEDQARDEPDLKRLRLALRKKKAEPDVAMVELKDLADRGSILGLLALAHIYRIGEVTNVDLNRAEYFYRRAAEAGSLTAYYHLGRQFLRQKRFDEALTAFSYASGKGYPPAIHFLGRIYWNGLGVSKDPDRAEKLLERAAARKSVIAKAMLATILIRHRPTWRRYIRGVWLRLAALCQFFFFLILEGPNSDRFQ